MVFNFMELPVPIAGVTHPQIFPLPFVPSYRKHLLANFLVLAVILGCMVRAAWASLPTITAQSFIMPQGVILRDRTGKELYRFYRMDDRIDLPLIAFPPALRSAVIAIEDERFYERSCLDVRALGRAALANIFEYKSQGASTITQQLLRTTFDLHDKTFSRKVLELSLACKMESVTSKDNILSLYLNHASFGGATYGAQKASQTYFATDVRDLTLGQSAVLAALLQRPTYFSPYGEHRKTTLSGATIRMVQLGTVKSLRDIPSGSVTIGLTGAFFPSAHAAGIFVPGRADEVLAAMRHGGSITEAAYAAAETELKTITFATPDYPVSTPYFPSLVQQEVSAIPAVGSDCRLQTSGCTIQSTLDPQMQAIAERLMLEHASTIQEKYHAQNIALVAIDRKTRQIVAYIGNVDFSPDENGARLDMAQVPRQPGSTFKPFVYATAFERGYTPDTFLQDTAVNLAGMHPQNYEGGYHGWVSIRHALAGSRNIPAIRTFFMVGGEDPILQEAARAGITQPLESRAQNRTTDPGYSYGYPLAIGTAEVPLLQMVTGYATLANSGSYLPLTAIQEVRNAQNAVVYSSKNRAQPVQAMDPLIARELTSILSDNMFRAGEYWKEQLTLSGIDAAAKTGTSNQCTDVDPATGNCLQSLPTDVWTIGYTPSFVVGVWAGNATHQPLTPDADGLNVAAPLWKEFLESAHALRPAAASRFPASSTFDKNAKTGFYAPAPQITQTQQKSVER